MTDITSNTSLNTGTLTIDTSANGTTTSAGISTDNTISSGTSCWDYWHTDYYPSVIHHSYPVYMQERAKDKGKQAYEIIKILKDKKLVKLGKVGDFIDLMDELIKIL